MNDELLAELSDLPDVEVAPSQWTGAPAIWVDGRELILDLAGRAVEANRGKP